MNINKFEVKMLLNDILKVEKFIMYGGEKNKSDMLNITKYSIEKNGYLIQISFIPYTVTSEYREAKMFLNIKKHNEVIMQEELKSSRKIEDFINIFEIRFIDSIFYINISLEANKSSFHLKKRCLVSNIKKPEEMDRLIAVVNFSDKLEILLFSYTMINYLSNYKFVELKQIEDILNKFLYYGYELNTTEKIQKLLKTKCLTFDEFFTNVMKVMMNILNLCITENYHETTDIYHIQTWITIKSSEIEKVL